MISTARHSAYPIRRGVRLFKTLFSDVKKELYKGWWIIFPRSENGYFLVKDETCWNPWEIGTAFETEQEAKDAIDKIPTSIQPFFKGDQ